MTTFNRNKMIQNLTHIWFISDVYTNKQNGVTVARKDILGEVKSIIHRNPHITSLSLWEEIHKATFDGNEETFSGESLPQTLSIARSKSTQVNQIGMIDLINCDEGQLDIEAYCDICQHLCVVLSVDDSDDKINPEYWTTAFDDDLTPIDAVVLASIP